ncbi:hypothetical protein GCM10027296_06130 [Chitinimonas naiadis]
MQVCFHKIGQHNDGQTIIRTENERRASAVRDGQLPCGDLLQHWPTGSPGAACTAIELFETHILSKPDLLNSRPLDKAMTHCATSFVVVSIPPGWRSRCKFAGSVR